MLKNSGQIEHLLDFNGEVFRESKFYYGFPDGFIPPLVFFFQEEPCRVVVMKKPLISWAPEDGLKLVDLPSLKLTPKVQTHLKMDGKRDDQFSGAFAVSFREFSISGF